MNPDEPIAEPVEPAAEVETPVEPAAAEPEKVEAEPAAEPADDGAKFDALLSDIFKDDADAGKDDKALVGAISREEIESMSPKHRAAFRALAARAAEKEGKLAADQKAWAEKREAEQRRLDAGVAELRRRQQALMSMVDFKTAREQAGKPAPRVDPTTPDGLRQLAEHTAQKAAAEGVLKVLAGVEQSKAQAEREAAYDRLKDTYPELRDEKVDAEFYQFLVKENEGIDRAKGEPLRMNAVQGARIFFAERRAQAAATAARDTAAAQAADRADSARAGIGRSAGGAAGKREITIPDDVFATNQVGAYLASLSPADRAALIAAEKRRAAAN